MDAPKIKAEFLLDMDGKPKGRSSGNYVIRVSIAGAPEHAHRVTYKLDDTYYDPVREVRDRESGFSEELTSYGDYEIKATVRMKDHSILTSRRLAEALKEQYADTSEHSILDAIKALSEN